MKNIIYTYTGFALVALAISARAALPELPWDVETTSARPVLREIMRGESINLRPRFLNQNQPMDLTSVYSVALRYRDQDMAEGSYYIATGAVHNASAGIVQIPWTPANEPAANIVQYQVVATSSDGSIMRGYGTIRFIGSIQGDPQAMTPTVAATFDWALITEHLNPEAAPFMGPSDLLAIDLRLDGHDTDIATLNTNLQEHIAAQAVVDAGQDQAIADLAVGQLSITTDATLTGTGRTNEPLAVATNIVSGAAAGSTATQPGHVHGVESITNFPALFTPTDLPTDYGTDWTTLTSSIAGKQPAGAYLTTETDPVWVSERAGYATTGTVAALDTRVTGVETGKLAKTNHYWTYADLPASPGYKVLSPRVIDGDYAPVWGGLGVFSTLGGSSYFTALEDVSAPNGWAFEIGGAGDGVRWYGTNLIPRIDQGVAAHGWGDWAGTVSTLTGRVGTNETDILALQDATNSYAISTNAIAIPTGKSITNATATLSWSDGSPQRWNIDINAVTNIALVGAGSNYLSSVELLIFPGTNNVSGWQGTWLSGAAEDVTHTWNKIFIDWTGTNAGLFYIDGGSSL